MMMFCRSLGAILTVLWLSMPAAAVGADTAPLKILRITPEGKDVPAGRQVVVEFDQPVVPLGRMERTAEELPITVTPELKCQWRWLDPSALACQLDEEQSLAPATTYRVTVAPGIRTQAGATLAEPVRHSFTTIRPAVENAWFQTWRSPGTPVLLVTFNQPMVRGAVTRHLYLRQAQGERRRFGLTVEPHPDDREPPVTVGADEARTRWQVSPVKELPLETAVGLMVEPGLISAQGPEAGTEAREAVRFDTFPPFRLVGLSCTANAGQEVKVSPGKALESQTRCSPLETIQLLFSAPVGLDMVKAHLRISPGFAAGPEGSDPWASAYAYGNLGAPHEKGQTYGVYLPQAWRPRQTYDLTVAANLLKDDFNRPLTQPVRIRFATDQMRPDYYLMHNPSVLEAQVDTQVPLFVTNLEEVTLNYDRVTTAGVERKLSHRLSLTGERDVTLPVSLGVRDMLGHRSGAVSGTIATRPKIEEDEWKRTFFAQVSPYQVHVKLGHFSTLVWVTDLGTGAPVPSALVRIYKEAPGVLAEAPGSEATTDGQGIALLPGTRELDPKLEALGWCEQESPCRRLFVRVTHDDQMALLPLDDNFLVDIYRASGATVSDAMQRDYGHISAWGTTAQGVYRAGDTIQYKFYVRNQDNTRLTAPPLEGYNLDIVDPTGKTVHTVKEIKLSAFGAYDGQFTLPKNGAVGWYHFKLSAAFTQTEWQPMQVLVSDFTPSPFRARVELNGTLFRPGDPLQITSTAALHSGGPYPDAPLRVVARVAEAIFSSDHPVAQGFSFYDDTQRSDRTLPVHEGEETLDDQGKQVAALSAPESEILYGRLLVESAVQDDRGKYVAAAASASFVGRDRFVGLQQTRWVYAAGEPAQIRFIVTDEKGRPTAGAEVALTVERQETVASRVKGAGNTYLTQYTQSWAAVTDQRVAATEAPGLFTFTPETPGYYRVTAAIQDTHQRPVRTQTYAYVAGKGEVLWETPDDNSLQLIPEKEKLQVGDTGRFLVKNPYPGARALVSVERYGVIRHWVQTLDGSTPIIEVPVTADDLPGFYLSVLVTSPRVDKPDTDGQVDLGKPGFRMGYRRVTVEDPAKQIRVELRPERATYKPGEKVRVALRAVPPQTAGAAEPMELAVAVLDEAVLDLNNQGRDYYDPYKGFYQLEPLDLQNYSLLTRLVGRQKFEKKGAAGPGDGGSDIGMRSLFKYVSYWNPSLAVDADGRAEIEFEAPDNLTGWRILAMAVTPTDRMGLGDATVRVNRATEIRPVMPNQVLQGDRFQAGFSIMNRTEKARRITVAIQATGPLAEAAAQTRTVELPAFKRETVWLPVTTRGAGSLTFTVTARDEADADGLIHILPVRQRQALDTAASHGSFDQASASETIQFPEKIHTDAGGVELVLAPTVIGNIDGAFDFMRAYPYGCWEQRLSRAVMASHFTRLRDYLPATATWQGSEAVPAQTLSEAAEFQAPNGGMSYYRPENEYVDPYLSAYTALAFTWLRADGHAVPEAVEKPLLAYLETLLKKEAIPDFYSKGMAAAVRAVALSALADHGRATAADLSRYRDHMPKMSLFGLAHYLQAALKIKGGEKTADDAFKRLMAHSHQSSGQTLFSEQLDSGFARLLSSSARTQAAILSALTAYGATPQGAGQVGDLPMRLTRAITLQRGARTHWANTQENIFGLKALVDYSAVYEKASPAMTVKALLDAQPLGETAFQDRRAAAVTFNRPIATDDPGRKAQLSIQREGTGRLYYTARLRYAALEATDPVNAGIEIRREYSVRRDGRWVLLTTPMQIRRAELVRVDLFLSLPAARHYVVVDDAVPGGLEAVNRDLATASGVDAEQAEYQAADGSWWFHFSDWRDYESSRWSFYHQELRHDSARFYSDYLPAGNYHLAYTAQAIAAGEFTVAPVLAEEMYDPDLYGRGTPAVLRVEEVSK
jgi:hypothetical protein